MGKAEGRRKTAGTNSKDEQKPAATTTTVQNLVKDGMNGLKNFLIDLVNGDENPDTCSPNDVNIDDLTCSTVNNGSKYWYNCYGEPMAPRYGYLTEIVPQPPRPPQKFVPISTECPKPKCRRVCCPVEPRPPCQHTDDSQCIRRLRSTSDIPNWRGSCRRNPPDCTFAFDRGDSQVNPFRCCPLGKAEDELHHRITTPLQPSPRPADDGHLDPNEDADLDRLQKCCPNPLSCSREHHTEYCNRPQYRSGKDKQGFAAEEPCEMCNQARVDSPCNCCYPEPFEECSYCLPPPQVPYYPMQPPCLPWWCNPSYQPPPFCPPQPKSKQPDWSRLFPLFLGKDKNQESCDPCKKEEYQSPLTSCRTPRVKVESNTKCDDHGLIWKHYGPVLDHLRNRKFHHVTADVNIIADGKIFPAHKIVLMTYSKYFRDIFLNNICQVEVDLCPLGVGKDGFQCVFDWMYTGRITISMCNIVVIWNAATLLKISALERKCKRYLRDLVKCQGQQGVCSLLSTLGLREDFLDATEVNVSCPAASTCQNPCREDLDFQEIKRTGLFLRFPKERLINLLTDDCVNITSEKEIFDVAASWLFFQWPSRKDCISLVMRCVRFPLMSRCEVLQCLSDPRYQCLWSDPTTISLAIIAYMYLNARKKGTADAGRLGVKLRTCITK